MLIRDALRVRPGDVVALAGAGGKTTLLYRLAAEARLAGWRVLVTSTTHMGLAPVEQTGPVFFDAEGDLTPALSRALNEQRRALVLGSRVRTDKLEGVSAARVAMLSALADLTLVEADGARQRSLKTPAPHEPVIPENATLLVVVSALDAVGKPFSEDRIHRLERVLAACGRRAADDVRPEDVVRTLADPAGYPNRFRNGMRTAVFLNKLEDAASRAAAAAIAPALTPPYDRVVGGSARAGEALLLAPTSALRA